MVHARTRIPSGSLSRTFPPEDEDGRAGRFDLARYGFALKASLSRASRNWRSASASAAIARVCIAGGIQQAAVEAK
ncbi:unnamed protein product [Sphagnum balticum]